MMTDKLRGAKFWRLTLDPVPTTRLWVDEATVHNGNVVWSGWEDGPPNGSIALGKCEFLLEDVEEAEFHFHMDSGHRIVMKVWPEDGDGGEAFAVLQEHIWLWLNREEA